MRTSETTIKYTNVLINYMAEPAKIRCPECDTTQVYYRVKTDDYQCQKCGHKWKKEGL